MELREQLQAALGDSLILEQELGGGGMSRVFVAHEAALNRKVVVKVLPSELAAAVSIERFRREIQLAAQLQHPHIVPLLSAGETEGLPYFTMPYVRGESLRGRLLKAGELPLSESVRILREVASALAYAHEAGIVHRDIKPENILISGGSAMVTDFGVAKALTAATGTPGGSSLTSLGVALGTPAYMAPEQATADPSVDHRADIYSLGIVAYEMLAGVTPFAGRSPPATLAAHVTEPPEPITARRPTVPPLVAALVMRCLEKHAADRPQTAAEVMHELDSLSTPSGGIAPSTRVSVVKRKRSIWQFVASGITVAAVFVLAVFASRRVEQEARARAEQNPAIAVLPFENVGRAEGQDFTDGMTEEITNRLASLHGIRVIGRQSAKGYVNSGKTPQEIARELGVKYLLTGTVRWDKSPDGKVLVRVSPALLKADDATQIWSEAYQTVLSGMFEIQSKVATEVADALNVSLLAPERAALTAEPTSDLEAYALYARARQLLEANFQAGPIREAAGLLRRATERDPRFTVAWALLAVAHTELYWTGNDRSSTRLNLALTALERATAIDSDDPDVHLARGIYQYHGERNYTRAIAEFDAVERARPSDPHAPLFKGAIKRRQGRYEEAIADFKRAVDLDPRNGANVLEVGNTLHIIRRYREAETYIDRGLILTPQEPLGPILKSAIAIDERGNVPEAVEHLRDGARTVQPQSSVVFMLQNETWPAVEDASLRQILTDARASNDISTGSFQVAKAALYHYLGDYSRARAHADSAATAIEAELKEAADSADLYHRLAFVEALRGHRAEALRASARANELLPESVDAWKAADRANTRARILVLLGDADGAIAALRQRVGQSGGMSANLVRLDPMFAPLRADPRFQQLINR